MAPWPLYGINLLDDLRPSVETRLVQIISLQSLSGLNDIGLLLGIQALKNADRYLGLFGKGDHPPRPSDDELQDVKDVENTLEAVVRYLTGQDRPRVVESRLAVGPSLTAPGTPTKKYRWTRADVDVAIYNYRNQLATKLVPLLVGVQDNQSAAIQEARKLVGRNVISGALGISKGMVSQSSAYKQIQEEFRLTMRVGSNKSRAIGLDIAIEEKSASEGDPVVEEVARREAVDVIWTKLNQRKLNQNDANYLKAIISLLEAGKTSAQKALEWAQTIIDNPGTLRVFRELQSFDW